MKKRGRHILDLLYYLTALKIRTLKPLVIIFFLLLLYAFSKYLNICYSFHPHFQGLQEKKGLHTELYHSQHGKKCLQRGKIELNFKKT